MSRQRRRATTSVSLFPFLAVLICAMGALILLLLVTTRRIRSDAIEKAQAALLQPAEEDRAELLETEVAFVGPEPSVKPTGLPAAATVPPQADPADAPAAVDPDAQLRDTIAKLSARRNRSRQHAENQRTRLREDNRRLNDSRTALRDVAHRLKEVEQQLLRRSESKQEVTIQIARLETQIDETQQRIRRVQQAQVPASSKYAFIPFDGKTGTSRRPLLIECTEQGIRFLPEDVLLTEDDLNGFTGDYNPLLAGVKALADHWTAQNQLGDESDTAPEPYVLLIVRPSGSVAYYAARKLLRHLGQPFGYELLEENRKLDLPKADPWAKAIVQKAVDQVLAEREKVVESVIADGNAGAHPFGASNAGQPATHGRGAHAADGRNGPLPRPRSHGRAALKDPDSGAPRPRSHGRAALKEFDSAAPRPRSHGRAALKEADSRTHGQASETDTPSNGGPRKIITSQKESSQESARQTFQRRWGLSDGRASIGYERQLTIDIRADRLIVGGRFVIPIGEGKTGKELVERVVKAIDADARGWGKPPESFYWVPSVQFVVSPGGNQYYERLHGPLHRLGLTSHVEFTPEAAPSQQPE